MSLTTENLEVLREVLESDVLSDREKKIIEMRFIDEPPATLKKVGEHIGLCGGRIRDIQNIAIRKIRRYCQELLNGEEVRVSQFDLDRARPMLAKLKPKRKPPKPKIPERYFIQWADETIAALEAFKRGEKVQMRGSYDYQWHDFDLAAQIRQGMISWRPKPPRGKRGTNGTDVG